MEIPQSAIEKIKNFSTPVIIGISGFGGSGKTTAANALGEILHAPVVCVDQFSIDRTIEDYTHWKGMGFERLEKEILLHFLKVRILFNMATGIIGQTRLLKLLKYLILDFSLSRELGFSDQNS